MSKQLYPLVLSRSDFKTVISFTMHKSIYRHMFLWLEIDFIPVYCEGYYGTGIKTVISFKVHKSIYRRVFCGWKLISYQCTLKDITELK